MIKAVCAKCKNELTIKEDISVNIKCPKCDGSIFKLTSVPVYPNIWQPNNVPKKQPNSPEQIKNKPEISRAK